MQRSLVMPAPSRRNYATYLNAGLLALVVALAYRLWATSRRAPVPDIEPLRPAYTPMAATPLVQPPSEKPIVLNIDDLRTSLDDTVATARPARRHHHHD